MTAALLEGCELGSYLPLYEVSDILGERMPRHSLNGVILHPLNSVHCRAMKLFLSLVIIRAALRRIQY